MLDSFLETLALIDSFLWGPWTMGFLAGVAIYFTVRSGFFQVTGLGYILRNTVGRLTSASASAKEDQTMTPVQAAATSLAGTVGMGNMAGVATALSVGGPGAIFWMWVLAFFGMMSKKVEITLGVHYRERGPDGQLRGGPQYYIRRGLGWNPLALLFSAGMLINAVFAASMLQSHTVGRALLASYDLNPYVVAVSMAAITALVVLGGIRRIGRFSERLVPIMTVAYLAGGDPGQLRDAPRRAELHLLARLLGNRGGRGCGRDRREHRDQARHGARYALQRGRHGQRADGTCHGPDR